MECDAADNPRGGSGSDAEVGAVIYPGMCAGRAAQSACPLAALPCTQLPAAPLPSESTRTSRPPTPNMPSCSTVPQYFPDGAASSPRLYDSPKAGTRASRRSGAASAAASASGAAGAAAAGVVHSALASLNGGSRLGGGGGGPAAQPAALGGSASGGAGPRGGGFGGFLAAAGGGVGGGFGKQKVSYGVRTPLRKDASWFAILVGGRGWGRAAGAPAAACVAVRGACEGR